MNLPILPAVARLVARQYVFACSDVGQQAGSKTGKKLAISTTYFQKTLCKIKNMTFILGERNVGK